MMESTPLSDEDLTFYSELFAIFDRDCNESIEPSELGDALRLAGCNPIDAEVDEMIQKAQHKVNSEGKLEFFDFCDIIAEYRKSAEQEQNELQSAFKVFDKKGDGTVDRAELRQVLIDNGMTDTELDDLFDTVDSSGNGLIDYSVLIRMIMGH